VVLTFLVNLELLRQYPKPMYLLLDEPAAALHPSGQRMFAKLVDSLSRTHQVIYSTHSPFMIDWNFPQRVRLLERDPKTRATTIENQPFRAAKDVWDPLRDAIGVTVGDVAVLSKTNLLVEGPIDQILIANASVALQHLDREHLDLSEVSILAYQNSRVLSYLLACAKAEERAVTILADDDQQGAEVRRIAARGGVPVVSITEFVSEFTAGDETAIEDVVGIDNYIRDVNDYYAGFTWFRPLDVYDVRLMKGTRTLGRCLEVLFAERFEKSFHKLGVAIHIANRLVAAPAAIPPSLAQLVKVLAERLR
jgi:predicted ATP-dependent endonuclease of OLD family